MKFKTLATAIAAATVSTAALAGGSAMADGHMGAPEFKISGDVTVGYFDNQGDSTFGSRGSEVIFDASQKVGGVTYFGSMTANFADSQIGGGDIATDDLYVGFKGAFGEVRMGDTDNGCDVVDTGWVADDNFDTHESGGCAAGDQNNISYRGSRGPVSYAVSYSPELNNTSLDDDGEFVRNDDGTLVWSNDGSAVDGDDVISVGVAGKVGPAQVSLGYESASGFHSRTRANGTKRLVARGENIVLGVRGDFGPVSVGVRANKFENEDFNGEDTYVGYTAQYTRGANKAYLGYGVIGDDDNSIFLGYNRALGSNTTFIAEFVGYEDSDEKYAIALKHAF